MYEWTIEHLVEIVLVGATGFLWWATRSLATSTRELVADSKANARIQLRAWVMLDEVSIQGIENGGVFRFAVSVKNTGQTPASNVKVGTTLRLAVGTVDEEDLVNVNDGEADSSQCLAVGTKVEHENQMPEPCSPEAWSALLSGEATFYVYGSITYTDVFNVEHTTFFRSYLAISELGKSRPKLTACVGGNLAT